jgi:hypothetical protein
MKRKIGATDLKAFLERAAAKKKQTESQTENQCNQLVIFQGQDGSGSGTSVPFILLLSILAYIPDVSYLLC